MVLLAAMKLLKGQDAALDNPVRLCVVSPGTLSFAFFRFLLFYPPSNTKLLPFLRYTSPSSLQFSGGKDQSTDKGKLFILSCLCLLLTWAALLTQQEEEAAAKESFYRADEEEMNYVRRETIEITFNRPLKSEQTCNIIRHSHAGLEGKEKGILRRSPEFLPRFVVFCLLL